MLTRKHCREWIGSISHRTWLILTRIMLTLFLIVLSSFIVFYYRIYVPCLKEEYFTDQLNCTIKEIKTNNHLCGNLQQDSCQFIIGECLISNNLQNISLYSTWVDYETSSHQCTINSCLTSEPTEFYINQTLIFIYWSLYFEQGYLKRISILEMNLAKMIMYGLLSILIITCSLMIIFIIILVIYDKYKGVIYPINTSSSKQSVNTQLPSIVIHKAPKLKKDRYHLTSTDSSSSSHRLVIPSEIAVIELMEFRSN